MARLEWHRSVGHGGSGGLSCFKVK